MLERTGRLGRSDLRAHPQAQSAAISHGKFNAPTPLVAAEVPVPLHNAPHRIERCSSHEAMIAVSVESRPILSFSRTQGRDARHARLGSALKEGRSAAVSPVVVDVHQAMREAPPPRRHASLGSALEGFQAISGAGLKREI